MDLRVLQYFLAVARERSFSGAAAALHLSQPTLSTQIKALEQELGTPLFDRGVSGSRKVSLTEEGMILRKRAEEILALVQRTEAEVTHSAQVVAGDVFIGAGETDGVRLLMQAAQRVQQSWPEVHFHISSGDGADVLEDLDKGLIDFGLVLQTVDAVKYEFIELPCQESWGVLMRRDAPLADKERITPQDLQGLPLILSRQAFSFSVLSQWLGADAASLPVAATYSLLYNGSLMVEEGMGYALCLDRIINTGGDSPLCFRPFAPPLQVRMYLVWKKHQILTKAAEKFLQAVREQSAAPVS